MAFLASTFTFETKGRGVFSGIFAWINQVWDRAARIYTPPHVNFVESRPSADSYTNRLYIVGGLTRNVLIDEDFRCLTQGILPPDIVPSVAVGAGSVIQLAYLRYYDEITGERSPLSRSKSYTGDENRAWTNLPTDVPGELTVVEGTAGIVAGVVVGTASNFHDLRPGDRIANAADLTRWAQVRLIISPTLMSIDDTGMTGGPGISLVCKPVSRVSHIEGWISANGTLPRFDFRVRIGTTAYSESIPALALGEADVDTFEAMPHGSMNVAYNDRQLIAGVQGRLDTLFVSAIGFPERYEGLSFRTDAGEEIVGLLKDGTVTIAVTRYPSAYRLQGYTEDDLDFQVFAPGMGGLGHHGNQIAGNGIAFIPGREQIQTFNGAFHGAMPTRQPEWARAYRENQIAFESGIGAVDPEGQTYRFAPFPLRLTGYGMDGPDENPTVPTPIDVPVGAFVYGLVASAVNFGTDPNFTIRKYHLDTHEWDVDPVYPSGSLGVTDITSVGDAQPNGSYAEAAQHWLLSRDDENFYVAGSNQATGNFSVSRINRLTGVFTVIFTIANTDTVPRGLRRGFWSIAEEGPGVFYVTGGDSPAHRGTYRCTTSGGVIDDDVYGPLGELDPMPFACGTVTRFAAAGTMIAAWPVAFRDLDSSGFITDAEKTVAVNTYTLRRRVSAGNWVGIAIPAPLSHFLITGPTIYTLPPVEVDGRLYIAAQWADDRGSDYAHSEIMIMDAAFNITQHFIDIGGFTGVVISNMFASVDGVTLYYFTTFRGLNFLGSWDGSRWNDTVAALPFDGGGAKPYFVASVGCYYFHSAVMYRSNGLDVTTWFVDSVDSSRASRGSDLFEDPV